MDSGRHWKSAATALVLATGLTGRQIASWGTPRNRWDFFWQRQDAAALIVAVLILTLVVYGIGMVLSRWEWSRKHRLHELALVIGLMAALLSQFPFLTGKSGPLGATGLWAGVGLLLAIGWKKWSARIVGFARSAPLVMLPLVPILFIQTLMWQPWDVSEFSDPPAPPARTGESRPLIVMVVFDEWSWFRTAPGGMLDEGMPNLRRLARQSVLVREARSAGLETKVSVPRLLFQSGGQLVTGNGVATWSDSAGIRPAREIPSMFDAAERLGYRSSVVGFYLNYRSLMGPDQPNRVCCDANVYRPPTWAATVGWMLLRNLQHWTDPISQALWPAVSARRYSTNWVRLVQVLRTSAMEALTTEPDNTFLLIHLPLPHPPFIFTAEGEFLGAYQGERMSDDSAGYRRNLRFTDQLLGGIMDQLERAGRLDRTLLVVTSDHSWRKEPDSTLMKLPDAGQRVPLLVKWPGQTSALVSDEPFCALGLWPVLEAAMTPPAPPAMTDSLWHAISASGREKSCVR
jgi:hypothetical protein